jgi:hypothetical protein
MFFLKISVSTVSLICARRMFYLHLFNCSKLVYSPHDGAQGQRHGPFQESAEVAHHM